MITSFTGRHSFLSNFHPSVIHAHGREWATAEHLFQARKTTNLLDAQKVWSAPNPAAAKRLGRTLPMRPDWDGVRKQVMLEVVMAKFAQSPELAALLEETGAAGLVEGNTWHDNYWGQCSCSACARAGRAIRAHNYLGKILMAVRDVLRPD